MSYHLRLASVAVALLVSQAAVAGEFELHTVSLHGGNNRDHDETVAWTDKDGKNWLTTTHYRGYNNVNLGAGYRWDSGWSAGVYWNSYYKPSAYVAKDWMFNSYTGVFLGVATGYDNVDHQPIAPIGGFIFRIPVTERLAVKVLAAPPLGNATDAVVHLTVAYTLDKP